MALPLLDGLVMLALEFLQSVSPDDVVTVLFKVAVCEKLMQPVEPEGTVTLLVELLVNVLQLTVDALARHMPFELDKVKLSMFI